MLDKRIKAGKTPLTVFSSDIKNFLHKSGYFADSPYDFEDLDKTVKGTLFSTANELVAETHELEAYNFFLPEEFVENRHYRPYNLKEFLNDFCLGDIVVFRRKETHEEYHYIFNGYFEGEIVLVTLGDDFSLNELFENFEVNVSGVFKPFGVLA